ncbi:unnamed protein product [Heterobilharzia americana]|nr:unnamed protein product [Heterobilharzia americana]
MYITTTGKNNNHNNEQVENKIHMHGEKSNTTCEQSSNYHQYISSTNQQIDITCLPEDYYADDEAFADEDNNELNHNNYYIHQNNDYTNHNEQYLSSKNNYNHINIDNDGDDDDVKLDGVKHLKDRKFTFFRSKLNDIDVYNKHSSMLSHSQSALNINQLNDIQHCHQVDQQTSQSSYTSPSRCLPKSSSSITTILHHQQYPISSNIPQTIDLPSPPSIQQQQQQQKLFNISSLRYHHKSLKHKDNKTLLNCDHDPIITTTTTTITTVNDVISSPTPSLSISASDGGGGGGFITFSVAYL